MKKDQPITIGVLKEELQKQGEDIKQDIRTEFREELQKQGENIKKDLRTDFRKEIRAQGVRFDTQIKIIDEHIQSQIGLLAESILDVREKIAILTEIVEKNTEDIEIIKLNVELIRNDLKTKVEKEEFLALEKRVSALEQKERKRVNC